MYVCVWKLGLISVALVKWAYRFYRKSQVVVKIERLFVVTWLWSGSRKSSVQYLRHLSMITQIKLTLFLFRFCRFPADDPQKVKMTRILEELINLTVKEKGVGSVPWSKHGLFSVLIRYTAPFDSCNLGGWSELTLFPQLTLENSKLLSLIIKFLFSLFVDHVSISSSNNLGQCWKSNRVIGHSSWLLYQGIFSRMCIHVFVTIFNSVLILMSVRIS